MVEASDLWEIGHFTSMAVGSMLLVMVFVSLGFLNGLDRDPGELFYVQLISLIGVGFAATLCAFMYIIMTLKELGGKAGRASSA